MSSAGDCNRSPGDWALAYARRGWHVFPCRDKKPLAPNGFHGASNDHQVVKNFWREHPDAEIGWLPGPSGHTVIDLDVGKNGGGNGLELFEQMRGPNPEGTDLIARTPSGGRHLVYRTPEDRSYGMANLKQVGIDIRCFGGYVVLPDGRPQRTWIDSDPLTDVADIAPAWLVTWLDTAVGPMREGSQPRTYGEMKPAGTATTERLQEVGSALQAIEATVGRDDWLKLIFAVHDALDGDARGAQIVEDWSAQAEPVTGHDGSGQYREDEAYRIYASAAGVAQRAFAAQQQRSITANTLFYMARKRGWQGEHMPQDLHVEFNPPTDRTSPEAASAHGASPALKLRDWTEVAELPMVRWQVRRLLPERSLALLAGDTMVGKSFVAIDLAMRLVHDKPFLGRKVRPCSVLYLCGEGQQGLTSRLRVWRDQHSVTPADAEDRYCLISDTIPELTPKSVHVIREEIKAIQAEREHAPGLVVVDTLSQALDGDENDASVTAPILRALAQVREEFDCTILIVHHTVKQDPRQETTREGLQRRVELTLNQIRGSGAITRNVDVAIGLQPARGEDDVYELKVLKQKDGGLGIPLRFERVICQTGRVDEEDEPETSCIVVPARKAPSVEDAEQRQRREQDELLERRIKRVVEAVKCEVYLRGRDTVAKAAGMKLIDGRAALDMAVARKLLFDIGSEKRGIYVYPDNLERARTALEEQKQARKTTRTRPQEGGAAPPIPPEDGRTGDPSPSLSSESSQTEGTVGTEQTGSMDDGMPEQPGGRRSRK